MVSGRDFAAEIRALWTTPSGLAHLGRHLTPLVGVVLLGDSPLLAFYLLLGELLLATWAPLAAFCWHFVQLWERVSPTIAWGFGNFLALFIALAAVFAALVLGPALMAFAPVLALQPDRVALTPAWNHPLWLALVPALLAQIRRGLAMVKRWRDLDASALITTWQQEVDPLLLRAALIAAFGVYCWLFAGFGIYLALLAIAHVLAWADANPERLKRSV